MTRTFSVVWLMPGVAGQVVLAVATVFLYDMRELEGILRALVIRHQIIAASAKRLRSASL